LKDISTIFVKCDNEKTLELAEMTELQGNPEQLKNNCVSALDVIN